MEGYPGDPESPSCRFMGRRAIFEAAVFEEVGMAGTRRHVTRLTVSR